MAICAERSGVSAPQNRGAVPLDLLRLRPAHGLDVGVDPDSDLGADRLIAQLRRLRLGALAWYQLRDQASPLRGHFNARQLRELKKCFIARTAGALNAHAAARVVVKALSPSPSIPYLFIKGFAASAVLYPHPALRPLGDVDLWLPPERFAEALKRLQRYGYSGEVKRSSDFVAQLRHPHGLSLDVHSSLRQSERLRFAFAEAYQRRQQVRVDDLDLPLPGLVDLFIIQAYSLASGELVESFNAWIDLRELLLRYPQMLDDAALRQRVRAAGLGAALWTVLWRLGQMWPELEINLKKIQWVMPSVTHSLALAALSPTLNRIWRGRRLPRRRQLVVKALLLQDLPTVARFALEHFKR